MENIFAGKTVYISGKVTGVDNYQERFGVVEEILHRMRVEDVFNPAASIRETETHKTAMLECLSVLTSFNTIINSRTQDAIVTPYFDYVLMLPDWKDSTGARMEYDVANACGIPVLFYSDHFTIQLP